MQLGRTSPLRRRNERRQEEGRLEQERRQLEKEKRREEEKRRQEEEGDPLSDQLQSAQALLQPQPDKKQCPPMGCKVTQTRNVTWIACDSCDQWYHIKCVSLTAKKAESLPSWNCGLC